MRNRMSEKSSMQMLSSVVVCSIFNVKLDNS